MITDQINSASQASEQRYRQLFANMPICIFVINLAATPATILEVNRRAELVYGYMSAELVGNPATHLVPEESRASVQNILQRVQRGETVTTETSSRHRDGTTFPVRVIATLDPTNSGHMIITAEDITAERQRRSETEAIEAERLRLRKFGRKVSGFIAGNGPRYTEQNVFIGKNGHMGRLYFQEEDERGFLSAIFSMNHVAARRFWLLPKQPPNTGDCSPHSRKSIRTMWRTAQVSSGRARPSRNDILRIAGFLCLSQDNTIFACHSERSEESLISEGERPFAIAQGITIGYSDTITKVVSEDKEIVNFRFA